MESQELQTNDPFLLKIITALRDFARILHSINGVSSFSKEMLDAAAKQLLMHLLTLCDVTQGAFLLTSQSPEDWREHVFSLADGHLFPAVVCHHISEATVLASLQQFSSEGSAIQWVVSEAGSYDTLLWKRSFTISPLIIQPQEEIPREAEERLSTHFQPSFQAFFLLRWQTQQMHTSMELWEQVLSLVADAVDAVLVHVLLSLRVRDLERQAHQREREPWELLRAELLATVSHELRSPLTSIKGYTATLLRHGHQIEQEERNEFLQAIREGSIRLEHIVDRLLELSHLETQKISFAPMPLHLPSLVQEAITATRQFHEGNLKRQSILFLHDDPLIEQADERLVVRGDRRLLRTMLDHFFENARLYSPPTSLIEVGVRAVEEREFRFSSDLPVDQAQRAILLYPPSPETQGLIELWIKDHGIGIALEDLQPIFERFYRVDTRLTRERIGFGGNF